MVKIFLLLKSSLFCKSFFVILFSTFWASKITSSGNSYGKLYSFIKDNISTPASLIPPIISVISPSALLLPCGNFVILTTTFWLFLALLKLFFDINISVLNSLSSGTTNPKFFLLVNVPTISFLLWFIVFTILPSFLFPSTVSSIIFINTSSPFTASLVLPLDIYISSSWPSIFTNPNPFSLPLNIPFIQFSKFSFFFFNIV